jgi:cytidylate kinase
MDGRDIGTDVFPDAELKIFMTAEPDIRARRRFDELVMKNIPSSIEVVKANLLARDTEDMTRAESPLRKAKDAIILDNSHLSREQQLEYVYNLAIQLIQRKKAVDA